MFENVYHFEYLRAKIQGDSKTSPDIRRRIAIATQKLNYLGSVSTCINLRLSNISIWKRIMDTEHRRHEKNTSVSD